ncbi:NAD(P)H-binding protein [Inquilinus sp. CAU 1745]|uniref:NAD(P)H-binding protein n=1 Tax=Inquilinus sp. CAU 1745 TaxID=3140369 RepID=UPI00325A8CB7
MTNRVGHGSEKGRAVAVYGATGHTGRFVVAELLRRGVEPIAVARDGAKLAEFAGTGVAVCVASIDAPETLDRAFSRAGAVINCAGPFLDTADIVAAAAIRAGAHYFDVTAEQPSASATYERFDRPARDAGVVAVPAMGFFGGFSDLLVTAAMDGWDAADEIRIMIALDSWRPTQGTRITGERNTARRQIVSNGRLAPLPVPAVELESDLPEPFGRRKFVELPLAEIMVIDRHVKTAELHNFITVNALQDIRDPKTPPPEASDETGRSAQRFLVEVTLRRGNDTRRIAAGGQDIYAFSAPLVCEAAQRALEGKALDTGANAPGALFDAKDFLKTLPLDWPA